MEQVKLAEGGATVVVDVGCAVQDSDESIWTLIDRFHPEVLYGFDPDPIIHHTEAVVDGTKLSISRKAAWTYDGEIEYAPAGIVGTVMRSREAHGEWEGWSPILVPCFDLAAFIEALPHERASIVLKLDVEGAEYPLLRHLVKRDVDQLLSLLLVEWHELPGGASARRRLRDELRCPVEQW